MSPATAVAIPTPATKAKKPSPIGTNINGIAHYTSSPSPSLANKKMAATAKPPGGAAGGAVAVPTVRPVNRARRDANSQVAGRHSRNSAGRRTGSISDDPSANGGCTLPYGNISCTSRPEVQRTLIITQSCPIHIFLPSMPAARLLSSYIYIPRIFDSMDKMACFNINRR